MQYPNLQKLIKISTNDIELTSSPMQGIDDDWLRLQKQLNRHFSSGKAPDTETQDTNAINELEHAKRYYKNLMLIKAMMDNSVVGIAAHADSIHNKDLKHLHSLFVDKDYRNKGVGTALVNKIISQLNGGKLQAYTHDYAPEAIKFYEDKGFKRYSTRKEEPASAKMVYTQ